MSQMSSRKSNADASFNQTMSSIRDSDTNSQMNKTLIGDSESQLSPTHRSNADPMMDSIAEKTLSPRTPAKKSLKASPSPSPRLNNSSMKDKISAMLQVGNISINETNLKHKDSNDETPNKQWFKARKVKKPPAFNMEDLSIYSAIY